MIFKQIDEILSGQKTQTRRVCKESEHLYFRVQIGAAALHEVLVYPSYRIKWQVGRTYAVVPKRGLPTVWWREKDGRVELLHEHSEYSALREFMAPMSQRTRRMAFDDIRNVGWQPLRIRITAIRREPLQSITEDDAWAEGVFNVEEYKFLWHSINGKTKGARWQDNPNVWVLTFEVVK